MTDLVPYERGRLRVNCTACGKPNAVILEKIDREPKCGECSQKLEVPGAPVELNDQNFSEFINNSPLPVLVDFWAPWCGPCKIMGPVLESFARKRSGQVIVAKMDTDQSPSTAGSLGIQAIPTLIVFNAGKEAARKTGAVPERELDILLAS